MQVKITRLDCLDDLFFATSLMQCGGGASHAGRACLLYIVYTLAIVVSIISEKACHGPTVQKFRAVVANLGYG